MSADIELKWEWSAERSIEQKMLVKIDNIKAKGAGLFGINKSPSLADNLPDAQIISGTVVNTNASLDGKTVSLIVPKLEIASIKPGGYAVIGIVESSTCICIVPAESIDVEINRVACP